MKTCDYCHAELVKHAHFCGICGNIIDVQADRLSNPLWSHYTQPYTPEESNNPTLPIGEEAEEEERWRRAALIGIGLIGAETFPQGSSAPMVQGTPQIGGVPTVQGTPQMPGSSFQGIQPAPQAGTFQPAPHTPPVVHPPVTPNPQLHSSPTLHHHPSQGGSSTAPSGPAPKPGCGPGLIITAIIIPIVIVASIAGLGLTIFAPAITLSGSSSISIGTSLVLHGSHFIPGSSISLIRDSTIPVYVTSQNHTNATSRAIDAGHVQTSLSAASAMATLLYSSSSTIKAASDGTFDVTIPTDSTWSPGQHTFTATETLTHRSASLSFTVLAPFTSTTSPTPSPTSTKTPTVSPTPNKTPTKTATPLPGVSPTVSPTPSPTTTAPSSQPVLSCINPTSVTLGPVTENFSYAVTSLVTLCAGGSGTLAWTAGWNASQAPWLSLNMAAGQISAPGQAQIVVSANAAQLGPGSYSATITFSSTSSSVTQALNVTFVVQAGCLKGSPGTLTFTGVQNISDPAPQTVGLTNCGAVGTWSAIVKTADGANWLSVSPTSNTLGGSGATHESVTISASNLTAQLVSGTYNGSVSFSLGSSTFVVQVTLQIAAPPTLSANTTSLTGSYDCTAPNGIYICYVTLTNNSQSASLTWTHIAQSIPSLVVKPASFTLAPGQSERVPLYISTNDCSSGASITFTGPANSVTVLWQCYPPIQ